MVMKDPIIPTFNETLKFLSNYSGELRQIGLNAINQKQLDCKIRLEMDSTEIKGPHVENNEIWFELNFLKFVWITVHCLFHVTESLMEHEINRTWDGDFHKLINKEPARSVFSLLVASISAKPGPISFLDGLPNPSLADRQIQTSNIIFHYSVAMLFVHELAHIVLRHQEVYGHIPLQCEKDADNFALETLCKPHSTDKEKRNAGIGMVSAIFASLMALGSIKQIIQGPDHQDLDSRLYNFLYSQRIDDSGADYYVKRMATVAISLFVLATGRQPLVGNAETVDELLESYFSYFDDLKSK
jgi:hypothetical protein